MKVLHVMQSDTGGANVSALRLHKGLIDLGVESEVLVHSKKTSNSDVLAYSDHVRKTWGRAISYFSRQLDNRYKLPKKQWGRDDILPMPTMGRIRSQQPDIINLHWFGSGFLGVSSIARLCKSDNVVWTLHDMRAFTGGCHYDEGCGKYTVCCGNCPQLRRSGEHDSSYHSLIRKQKHLANAKMVIVSPSKWLAECAANSSVFQNLPIEVIPYGIDLNCFRPLEKNICRQALGIPENVKVVLFGAVASTHDKRKGFDFLLDSIARLRKNRLAERFYLLIFGTSTPYEELGFEIQGKCLGFVDSVDRMVQTYNAADVFVVPSRQDNLPNTVIESLSCGTPVVAFGIGGMPDMIEHRHNGFLATPYETDELAQGIQFCVDPANSSLRLAARKKAENNYANELQANRYLDLYQGLLDSRTSV